MTTVTIKTPIKGLTQHNFQDGLALASALFEIYKDKFMEQIYDFRELEANEITKDMINSINIAKGQSKDLLHNI